MTTEENEPRTTALTIRQMMPVIEHKSEMAARQEFVKECLKPGVHFLKIPGTDKDTLVKPGAEEVLAHFYCRPAYAMLPQTIVDWDRPFCAFFYKCQAINWITGTIMGEGEGSCNSAEEKYALRYVKPLCDCGHELLRSKTEAEWYCWRKKGGCGRTYPLDFIKDSGGKREATPAEWATQVNTIQKMAEKRALIACALTLGGVSELFSQDLEDMTPSGDIIEGEAIPLAEDDPQSDEPRPAATPTPRARPTPATRPRTKDEIKAYMDRIDVMLQERDLTMIELCERLGCKDPEIVDKLTEWTRANDRAVSSLLDEMRDAKVPTEPEQAPLPA